jgi:hypothetical protein
MRRVLSLAVPVLLAACSDGAADTGEGSSDDTADVPITGYAVDFSTDPSPPVAGQAAQFTETVTDQIGRPIEDLQQNHDRMVHTLFISADLSSFQHLHQEDFTAITADDLRNATFSFPVTLPMSGDYVVAFDYAHDNQFLQTVGALEATGSPAQGEQDLTVNTEADSDGIHGVLTWDVEPYAAYTAAWTVHLTDANGDVTDIVPWVGADAHAAIISSDLSIVTHTHAWFAGMDNMTPSMEMPHLYDGPDIPFQYVFDQPGTYKMWVQFARSDAPDTPHVLSFVFEVMP